MGQFWQLKAKPWWSHNECNKRPADLLAARKHLWFQIQESEEKPKKKNKRNIPEQVLIWADHLKKKHNLNL